MHHNIVYLYHGIKIVTLNHDIVIVYYESNNVSIIKFVKHNLVMVFAKDNLFRLSQMIPKHHIVSYWFCTFLFVNFLNDNVIAFFREKLFYSEGNINEKLHYIVIFAVLFHHNVQNHFRKELNFLETEITVGLLSTCLFKN